ncbi:MAG: inverse autotransporter beta domain-containing protein [bacterium]
MQAISETDLRKLLFPKKSGNSFAIAILFSLYFPSVLLAAQDNLFSSENKYQPYFEIGGAKYFNQNSTVAGIYDLFIPMLQKDDQLLFTDLRLFDRSGSSFEGNAHLGYRKLYSDTEQMFGIYGAFDRKRTTERNFFNQLTLGFEYWQSKFFIGGNIYKPIGATQKPLSTLQVKIEKMPLYFPDPTTGSRTQIIISQNVEKAIPGADLELGYAITDSLTGYVGGYYFAAQNVKTVAGPRARLTYDYMKPTGRLLGILDGVSIEAGAQHDKPRHTSAYIGIKFKIGLTNTKRNSNIQGFARHMVELVRRDPGIVYQNTEIPHPLYVSIAKTPITSSDFISNFGITEKTTLPELSAIINKLISYLSKDTIDDNSIYNYYRTLVCEIANQFKLNLQDIYSIFDKLFNRQSTSTPSTNDQNTLPNLPSVPPGGHKSNPDDSAADNTYNTIKDDNNLHTQKNESVNNLNITTKSNDEPTPPPSLGNTNNETFSKPTNSTSIINEDPRIVVVRAITDFASWGLDYYPKGIITNKYDLDKGTFLYFLTISVNAKNLRAIPAFLASCYTAKDQIGCLYDAFSWESIGTFAKTKEATIAINNFGGSKYIRGKWIGPLSTYVGLPQIEKFIKNDKLWWGAGFIFPAVIAKPISILYENHMTNRTWSWENTGTIVGNAAWYGTTGYLKLHIDKKYVHHIIWLEISAELLALTLKTPFDFISWARESDPKKATAAWTKFSDDTHVIFGSLFLGMPYVLDMSYDVFNYIALQESDPKKPVFEQKIYADLINIILAYATGRFFWSAVATCYI